MSDKREKCNPSGELYCTAMDRSLAPTEAHVKGLSVLSTWNLSGKPTRSWTFVVYRTSPRDRGVALNLCPWCGVSLRPDASPSPPEGGGRDV